MPRSLLVAGDRPDEPPSHRCLRPPPPSAPRDVAVTRALSSRCRRYVPSSSGAFTKTLFSSEATSTHRDSPADHGLAWVTIETRSGT